MVYLAEAQTGRNLNHDLANVKKVMKMGTDPTLRIKQCQCFPMEIAGI